MSILSRNPDGTFQTLIHGQEKTRTERDIAQMLNLRKGPLHEMLREATRIGKTSVPTTSLNVNPSTHLSQPSQGGSSRGDASHNASSNDKSLQTGDGVTQTTTSQVLQPATVNEALTSLQPLANEAKKLEQEWDQLESDRQWADLRLRTATPVDSSQGRSLRPGAPVPSLLPKRHLSLNEIQGLKEQIAGINERLAAIEKRQAEIIHRARTMLTIPREMQGQVTVQNEGLMKAFNPELYHLATAGNELVTNYVHASLLPEVSFEQTSGDRAGYDSRSGTIWINTAQTRPDIVMHEVTHGIEWKQTVIQENGKTVIRYPVMEKAHAFLMKRAGQEKPQRLKDLDPKNAHRYEDNEVAYEDQWKEKGGSPYSGKVYDGQSTEILTVGIQRLHKNPLKFLRQDPEYFTFVISTLRYPHL